MLLNSAVPGGTLDPILQDQYILLGFLDIPQDLLEGLEKPILEEEMLHATKSLPKNKAPGPDGFPNSFFIRRLWTVSSPLWLNYSELFQIRVRSPPK